MPADSLRSTGNRWGKWLLCAGIAVCALILTYWPQGLARFRYDRSALMSGEIWRVASAHLVHLNTAHLFLNVLGLFLICELLWDDLPLKHGLGLLLFSAIGVSGLLWLLRPELVWYAGLSGVLHGLWAGCALAAWRMRSGIPNKWLTMPRIVGSVGFVLLLAKLMVEWRYGASMRAAQAIGAPVIAPAHLYGALSGIGYILLWGFASASRRKK